MRVQQTELVGDTMRTPNRVVWLAVFVAFIGLVSSVQAQRADRGIITGIVTDPTGSSVVGAPALTLFSQPTTPEPLRLPPWFWVPIP